MSLVPARVCNTKTQSSQVDPSFCFTLRSVDLQLTRTINNSQLFRNPTPEYLSNNRSTRVIRIAQMQPICEFHAPSLVVQLVHKRPVLHQDTVGRDACNPITVCAMYRFNVAGPSAKRSKVCRGGIRNAGRRMDGREGLVESLGDNSC